MKQQHWHNSFFMSAYVANCLPVRCFLKGTKRWTSPAPILPTRLVTTKLQEYGLEVMDHPQYSSKLAYGNFHLLGPHKKHLADKQFVPDTGVRQAVTSGYGHLSCWDISLDAMVEKCLNVCDECRGLLRTSATHMPCRHQSPNKVLGIRILLPYI